MNMFHTSLKYYRQTLNNWVEIFKVTIGNIFIWFRQQIGKVTLSLLICKINATNYKIINKKNIFLNTHRKAPTINENTPNLHCNDFIYDKVKNKKFINIHAFFCHKRNMTLIV